MRPNNFVRQLARVILIGVLVPRLALAQATPAVPEFQLELKSDFAPQVVKTPTGEEGVWFNNTDAQYLLYMRVTLIPGLLQLDARNAQIVENLNKQIAMTTQIVDLQGGQTALVKDALNDTRKELEKCRAEQSSFWSSPLLIAGAAFLAGMLVTGGIVYMTRK